LDDKIFIDETKEKAKKVHRLNCKKLLPLLEKTEQILKGFF